MFSETFGAALSRRFFFFNILLEKIIVLIGEVARRTFVEK